MSISTKFVKTIALVAVTVMMSMSANAAPVVWTLNGVTFDDGGTASGSFTYDADTNTFSAIAITTTAGSTLGGASYNTPVPGYTSNEAQLVVVNSANGPDYTGSPVFFPEFAPVLSNAGGVVNLDTDDAETTCGDASCSGPGQAPMRAVTAGTLSGVPAPAEVAAVPTMPFYALALTVLGLLTVP